LKDVFEPCVYSKNLALYRPFIEEGRPYFPEEMNASKNTSNPIFAALLNCLTCKPHLCRAGMPGILLNFQEARVYRHPLQWLFNFPCIPEAARESLDGLSDGSEVYFE